MYQLAITNGYTWNYLIYTAEQDPIAALGHAETIVMNLLDGLSGCYRTIVADKFFASISLAKSLLAHDTFLIGTLRRNRTVSGKEFLRRKLKRGEVYGLQNEQGVKFIMWKDKKDVLMISTKPSHSADVVESGKTNFRNEPIMKPKVVVDYNKGRQGTDLSDQLLAYYTCLRRSLKWYRKVAFELIFGTAIVNSYLVYREHYSTNNMTILKFRESPVRSLLLGMLFEELKPSSRQKATSQVKRKLTDHKLEEKEGCANDVRRWCVGCYEKLRQQQSRETSAMTAKRIKTFCPDCDQFFRLDCFNEKHFSK